MIGYLTVSSQTIFDEVLLKMTEQESPALQQTGADVIYQAARRHAIFKVTVV